MADETKGDGTIKVNVQTIVVLIILVLQTFNTWMQNNTDTKVNVVRDQSQKNAKAVEDVREDLRGMKPLMYGAKKE